MTLDGRFAEQSLSGKSIETLTGACTCVNAFNDPVYWGTVYGETTVTNPAGSHLSTSPDLLPNDPPSASSGAFVSRTRRALIQGAFDPQLTRVASE